MLDHLLAVMRFACCIASTNSFSSRSVLPQSLLARVLLLLMFSSLNKRDSPSIIASINPPSGGVSSRSISLEKDEEGSFEFEISLSFFSNGFSLTDGSSLGKVANRIAKLRLKPTRQIFTAKYAKSAKNF
jgi:hypothetical protein